MITADPQLKPADSTHLLEDRMEELHQMLEAERVEAREMAQRKFVREEKRAMR